jgi:hypothetical protein
MVSSVVTSPHHLPDVNNLLHDARYFILTAAFGTFVILILSYIFLLLMCQMLAYCREKRKDSNRITSDKTPNCPAPSPRPHVGESNTENFTGPVATFTTYPLRNE